MHETLYDDFVEGFVELTRKYVLGNPLDADDDARPAGAHARPPTSSAARSRAPIAAGAQRADRRAEPSRPSRPGTPYLAPQVLLDVDHSMPVMREEIFGPVAGIMKVSSDEEAIALMNDSDFGLTAAIWTSDEEAALAHRRPRRDRHLVHEPLRLPRPGAGVDRRQGFRARLHAVGRSATST